MVLLVIGAIILFGLMILFLPAQKKYDEYEIDVMKVNGIPGTKEFCHALLTEYDLSGTPEAAEHNNSLWKTYKHLLPNTLLMPDDGGKRTWTKIGLITLEKTHKRNIRYLERHPGEWLGREQEVDQFAFGLPVFYDENEKIELKGKERKMAKLADIATGIGSSAVILFPVSMVLLFFDVNLTYLFVALGISAGLLVSSIGFLAWYDRIYAEKQGHASQRHIEGM